MAASPQYVTLAPGVVSTLTFDFDFSTIEVINVDGASPIYFNVNSASNPGVAATGSEVVTAGTGAFAQASANRTENSIVKLVSPGTVNVAVRAW